MGKKFPCCCMKAKLSAETSKLVNDIFDQIDKDKSGEVDLEEALAMFKRFSKVAAKELLSKMDQNKDNKLQRSEWNEYFRLVLETGDYTEADIKEELNAFINDGEAFTFRVTLTEAGPNGTSKRNSEIEKTIN